MSEQQTEPPQLQSGTFEGQYLDAFGYRGRIRVDVESKEGVLQGKYEMVLATEDKPLVIAGHLDGKYGKSGEVMMRLTNEKTKVSLEYSAKLQAAGSFAKQCLMGVVKAPAKSGFGGGVWIAWQYAGRRPDGSKGCAKN